MYKSHPRNNFIFDKSGRKRPGYNAGFIIPEQKRMSATDTDRKNRSRVLRQIEEAVSKGEDLDKVVERLASDNEINKQFEYLTRNGLDLKGIFKSWYESSQKNKDEVNPYLGRL